MIGKTKKGFSLMEMLIVIGILAIVASASVPVAEISFTSTKEEELMASLDSVREAIASWRRDCRNAVVAQYGYDNLTDVPYCNLCPPSLEALVVVNKNESDGCYYDYNGNCVSRIYKVDALGVSTQIATFVPKKYLDKIPEDPFVGRPCWLVHVASGSCYAAYNFREANTTRGYTESDFKRGHIGSLDPEPNYQGVFDVSCIPSFAVEPDDYFTRRGYNISVDGTLYEDW